MHSGPKTSRQRSIAWPVRWGRSILMNKTYLFHCLINSLIIGLFVSLF